MKIKLTIGKVAAAAGVNVETIRFYQRRGLLSEPPKKLGGLRYYEEAVIERVQFIKRAQGIGFTLEEIIALLDLNQSNVCAKTHDAAEQKLKIVEEKIRDLERIRLTLRNLIHHCEAGAIDMPCPIIEALLHGNTDSGKSK